MSPWFAFIAQPICDTRYDPEYSVMIDDRLCAGKTALDVQSFERILDNFGNFAVYLYLIFDEI